MSPGRYAAMWGAVARLAAAPEPHPYAISRGLPATFPVTPNAIYIATDGAGVVVYVGSSIRSVRERLQEHVQERGRGREWDEIWVIVLKEDLPERLVRLAEGRVGRALQPRDSKVLPRC